ncbi:MAG: BtpA/SgcQ family protein [Planctomycetes bacterium]|nr:BtpA/SgcQ family protein [Planctomycetota bacterium]
MFGVSERVRAPCADDSQKLARIAALGEGVPVVRSAGPRYAAAVDHPLFGKGPRLIGVVHLRALPGAPRFDGDLEDVLASAQADARALVDGGCDGVIVENFGDVPFFPRDVPPETIAAMARAVARVVDLAGKVPVGVNVLRNDARAALGICAATGASFVRVNVHTSAAVTDQGLLEGHAAWTLRERARLCPEVAILADVHVKHASPLGSESPAEAAADVVHRGLADAVIVTGSGTGRPPSREVLAHVRRRIHGTPLFVGSGLTDANAPRLFEAADGAVVGTSLKVEGRLDAPVDAARVRRLRELLDGLPEPLEDLRL